MNTALCELSAESPSQALPQKETQAKEVLQGETSELRLKSADGKGHPTACADEWRWGRLVGRAQGGRVYEGNLGSGWMSPAGQGREFRLRSLKGRGHCRVFPQGLA